MKTHPYRNFTGRRGVALILVLAFIALVSALLVAFFSTTSNSRREAAQFEAGVSVAQLSDTATNIVISQIADATRSWEVPAPRSTQKGSGDRLTYATQPGMIRTYDANGGVGRAFKLYSSDTMVTKPDVEWVVKNELPNEVPGDWAAKPAGFVDLNAPVLTPDPRGTIVPEGSSQTYSANYPILDPGGLPAPNQANSGIQGFDLLNVPGYGGPSNSGRPMVNNPSYNPVAVPKAGTSGNPAPMPVKWLYVLRNGTITSPADIVDNGMTATWSNLPDTSPNKPSKTNPIVGRIAFWADDDTAKLNPNTHSEGIAWAPAIASGDFPSSPYGEKQLRERQPIRAEYQRYPGHPAGVSLSPLFGIIPQYLHIANDNLPDYYGKLLPYYNLVPRIGAGGSMGGTAVTYDQNTPFTEITPDQDRLFATVDELAYTPNYGPAAGGNPSQRVPFPSIKRQDLEKMKFFLTTNARAAEVNLFNQPRIGMWMAQQEEDPNKGKGGGPIRPRNAKDELLAFCSTINGFEYYFERHSIYLREKVNDRTKHTTIPSYQLPKYGYVPPSSQHPYLDWMPRNQDLYRYLQKLTSEPIPGFGGKFTDRYPVPQRDQILTQMVDLLRLTNSYALNSDAALRYEYAPARQMPDAVSGETQIVPLVPPDSAGAAGAGTKGIGRFPTVTEAMFVFYNTTLPPNPPIAADKPDPRKMRILLALEPFTPNAGSWTWSPLVRYVVKGLDKITINGERNHFPSVLTNLVTSRCGYGSGGNHNTAHTGTFANFRYWGGAGNDNTKVVPAPGVIPNEETGYAFVSKEIPYDFNKTPKTFSLSVADDGADKDLIVVEVHTGYAETAGPDTLIQRIELRMPAIGALPIPLDAGADRDFNNRIGKDKFNIVNANDTVRSLEINPAGPSRGDLRLVAAMKVVPPEFYAPYAGGTDGPGYTDASARIIHSFRNGDGGTVTGGKFQTALVQGQRGNFIAARGMDGAKMVSGAIGDWDNGPYGFQDGAYINKPDDYYGSNQGDWYSAPTNTPNRQVSSAVVFGSLPANVSRNSPEPWRTLLFNPTPAAGTAHPGLTPFAPGTKRNRDHLFLDFFTMPIVEPFAISEPLSSMGKVNLNYQLAPFSYITRATALHGVMKSVRVAAVPTSGPSGLLRKSIDIPETLKGFQERFDNPAKGGMFRSASEICDMHLVPTGASLTAVRAGWWSSYLRTGDNARETPYGQIYARTTTKSNTFTVHMRVQALRKRPGNDSASVWREDVDGVVAEYRGSSTVEHYVDLGDKSLPDFATNTDATLDTFYKFRVVQTKRFNP